MFGLIFMIPCFTVLVKPSILGLVMEDMNVFLLCVYFFFSQNQNHATHVSLKLLSFNTIFRKPFLCHSISAHFQFLQNLLICRCHI